MKTMDLEKWEDFLAHCGQFREEFTERQTANPFTVISNPIFRGQGDARWPLATTLERRYPFCTRVIDYARVMARVRPHLESMTDATWSDVTLAKWSDYLADSNFVGRAWDPPGYDFMVHVRHNGFPSPLLDWTKSPYVAAYFAFSSAPPDAERVAIVMFTEYAAGGNRYGLGDAVITAPGEYVRTHPRHFRQQGVYTICIRRQSEEWHFAPHETVPRVHGQDELLAYTLPLSERDRVLRYLDEFNVNAFTLFDTEESLLDSLARREFAVIREAQELGAVRRAEILR